MIGMLRLVAWTKRLALATERLADNSDQALAILMRIYPEPRRRAEGEHAVEVSVASVDDWNARWRADHPTYGEDE